MKSSLMILAALALAVVPVRGDVIFSDNFTTAATSPAANAGDFDWHLFGSLSSSSLPGASPGNYLSVKGTGGGGASQFGAYKGFTLGGDNTLAAGQSLTYSMRFAGGTLYTADNAFRLFLGTRAGTPADINADSGSAFNATSSDRKGFLLIMGAGTSTAGAEIAFGDTSNPGNALNTTLIGGFVNGFSNLFSGADSGLPSVADYTDEKTLTLNILRLNSNTYRVSGSYEFSPSVTHTFSDIDLTAGDVAFDTVGFGLRDWAVDRELRVSEISLSVVPEPSSVLLILLGALFAGIRVRMRGRP